MERRPVAVKYARPSGPLVVGVVDHRTAAAPRVIDFDPHPATQLGPPKTPEKDIWRADSRSREPDAIKTIRHGGENVPDRHP